MKGRVYSVAILFFLVLSGFTYAASIEDLGIYDANGQEVVLIGSATTTVELRFTVKEENPSIPIIVDLSAFYTRANLAQVESRQEWVDPTLLEGPRYRTDINIKNQYCSPLVENSHFGYYCQVPNIKLSPTLGADSSLPISFQVGETITEAIRFQTDTNPPQVVQFITDFCTNEACFLPKGVPTNISLIATDDNDLNPFLVFFSLEGFGTEPFSVCEGTTCVRQNYLITDCRSKDEFSIRLATGSTDAYGNPFDTSIEPKILICDEKTPGEDFLPELNTGIDIDLGTPPLPFPNYKNGDDILITATITEDVSGLNAYANFNSLTRDLSVDDTEESEFLLTPGDCRILQDNVYECVWRVQARTGTHEIEFIFEDNAGHKTLPEKRVVIVDPYDANITTEELDIFRNIEATPNSARGYSRLAIQMATQNGIEYPIFAEFTPRLKDASQDVEILKTFVSSSDCSYTGEIPDTLVSEEDGIEEVDTIAAANFVSGVEISNEFFNYKDATTMNSIRIKMREESLQIALNEFDFVCSVKAVIKLDGVAIAEPAEFDVTIPLILRDSAIDASGRTIGKAYYDKIKKKEEQIDTGFVRTVSSVRKVLNTMEGVCTTVDMVSVGVSTLRGAEAVSQACAPSVPACKSTSNFLAKIGGKIAGFVEPIIELDFMKANAGDLSLDIIPGVEKDDNIMDAACKVATCSGEHRLFNLNEELFGDDLNPDEWFGKGTYLESENEYWKDVGVGFRDDLLDGVGVPDAQDSLLSSINTMCIPGVIYHIDKYRQMNCEQLSCYKRAAELGLDISMCDQAQARSVCMATYGELAELSPTKFVEDLGDNFNAIIQNSLPAAAKNVLGTLACRATKPDVEFIQKPDLVRLGLILSCKIPKAVAQVSYQISDAAHSNTNFNIPDGDACDFALCNAQDISDCASAPPPFLQGLVANNPAILEERDDIDPTRYQEVAVNSESIERYKRLSNKIDDDFTSAEMADLDRFSSLSRVPKPTEPSQQDLRTYYAKLAGDVSSAMTIADGLGLGIPLRIYPDGEVKGYTDDFRIAENLPTLQELGVIAQNALDARSIAYDNLQADLSKDAIDAWSNAVSLEEDGSVGFDELDVRYNDGEIEFYRVTTSNNGDTSTTLVSSAQGTRKQAKRIKTYVEASLAANTAEQQYFSLQNELSAQNERRLREAYRNQIEEEKSKLDEKKDAEKISELDAEIENLERIDQINNELSGLDPVEDSEQINTLLDELEALEEGVDDLVDDKLGTFAKTMRQESKISPEKRLENARLEQNIKLQEAIGLGVNMGVQWAFQLGVLDELQWDDSLGWTFINDLGNVLNSNNRRATICDDITSIRASDAYESNVVQCDSANFCQPVLSFAGERIKNQENKWVYSIQWSLGNVANLDPTQQNQDNQILYNVLLKSNTNADYRLHQESDWASIPYGINGRNIFDNIKTSFVSKNEYDKVCFIFDRPFPPGGASNRRTEVCRDVVEVQVNDAFNTGEPTFLDENGDVAINTGTNQNSPGRMKIEVPQE